MLKEGYQRSSIDRDILEQAVSALNSADKHGNAGSRQRFGEQLTAAIDIAHRGLAASGT